MRLILMGAAGIGLAAQAAIFDDVRLALARGDFALAERMLAADQARGTSVEGLLAESWIARALLDAGRVPDAERYAADIRTRTLPVLERRKLDADGALPLALGAAIEVHAQALARSGERGEAVSFLGAEASRWKGTSIQSRIQKNLNLLTLEGKLAPPIAVAQWTGPLKPLPLSALRGHPVLLFFWAHWCVDCKSEAAVLRDLVARYGPAGLKVVGPTMHYGFIGGGEEASVSKENEWIEQTRVKYYAGVGDMPVPVSDATLRLYGVSTTPTLVLIDRKGVVRLYHPGVMTYQELAPLVAKLLGT